MQGIDKEDDICWRSRRSDECMNAWLLLPLIPVFYTLALDPSSFTMGFNQGRGGFLFASALLLVEYAESKLLPRQLSNRKVMSITILLGLALAYFTAAIFFNLHKYLWSSGEYWLGITILHSWIWFFDHLVYTVYAALAIVLIFGARGLRELPTPVMYLSGMSIVLALDTFFPFDTLGGLQTIVPVILDIDASLLKLIGITATVQGNAIAMQGSFGRVALAVFWPSAGIHSIIIYSLVMLTFLVKLDSLSKTGSILYFTLGLMGTFFINVLRVFLLSCYLAMAGASGFESFHGIAGEALFLPWVLGYTLLVGRVSSRAG